MTWKITPTLPTYANENIVTSGLVLNLDAGKLASYPGSGTIWTDLSGLGNNGTLTNGPTYSSGNGGFLGFNGTSQYVNLGSKFRYQDNFTVECVAKINSAAPSNGPCGSQNPIITNKDYGWNMMFSGTTGKPYWGIYNSVSASRSVGSTTGSFGQWVHCVAYKSGTTIELYVNGVSQGTNTLTTNAVYYDTSLSCTIGGNHPCGGPIFYLNGSVPVSRIYSRALSATEIAQNFNALRYRYGI